MSNTNRRTRRTFDREIGPREVGGRYYSHVAGRTYTVIDLDPGPRDRWPLWQITVRWDDDATTGSHCTGWDYERDYVL